MNLSQTFMGAHLKPYSAMRAIGFEDNMPLSTWMRILKPARKRMCVPHEAPSDVEHDDHG